MFPCCDNQDCDLCGGSGIYVEEPTIFDEDCPTVTIASQMGYGSDHYLLP